MDIFTLRRTIMRWWLTSIFIRILLNYIKMDHKDKANYSGMLFEASQFNFFCFLLPKSKMVFAFDLGDNISNDWFDDIDSYNVPDVFINNFCGLRVLQVNLRSIKMLNRFDIFKYYSQSTEHA